MLKEEKQLQREYGSDWINIINWLYISCYQKLSEKFIEKFQDKVDWFYISQCQKLSEKFIEKFQDNVDWHWISADQQLSEKFIEKHKDKVNWYYISKYQKLSEKFIEKFQDKVDWHYISEYQTLSESFIEKHKDKVNWCRISAYQKLSEKFIEKHKDKVDIQVQLKNHHRKYDAIEECKVYAKKHGLDIKDGYLYAFRNHDQYGRGSCNKTIFYNKKNVEYRDWHCDVNPENSNSFGLGIWPNGNVAVRVKVEDFGCAVQEDGKGKARVWAFEMI